MDLKTWLWTIGSLLGAAGMNIVCNDIYDKCGRWAERLIINAARKVSCRDRKRLQAEWLCDLSFVSGNIGKLRFAISIIWAAKTLSRDRFGGHTVLSVDSMINSLLTVILLNFFSTLADFQVYPSVPMLLSGIGCTLLGAAAIYRLVQLRKHQKFIRLRHRRTEQKGIPPIIRS